MFQKIGLFQDPHAYVRYEIASLNLHDMEDQDLLDAVNALTYPQAKLLERLLCNWFITADVPIDDIVLTVQDFERLIAQVQIGSGVAETLLQFYNKNLHTAMQGGERSD